MSESVAVSGSSGWMVSPSWDMAFIIASPVAIVPALWLLAQANDALLGVVAGGEVNVRELGDGVANALVDVA